MPNLTDSDRTFIIANGGILLAEGALIRFDRHLSKPDKTVKRFLREHGYKVTNESGKKFRPYIDYEYAL